jgi:hypothetical protein
VLRVWSMKRAVGLLAIAFAIPCAEGCKSTSRNDMIDPDDRASLAVPSEPARGGGPVSTAGALNLLAEARCDREAACGMLGENKSHADREGCERDALKTHAGDIELLGCKSTVDATKVAACADKLRKDACDRAARDASAVCGTDKLCVKD